MNDPKAIVQSYGISLNESKEEFMFTKKEKRLIYYRKKSDTD